MWTFMMWKSMPKQEWAFTCLKVIGVWIITGRMAEKRQATEHSNIFEEKGEMIDIKICHSL